MNRPDNVHCVLLGIVEFNCEGQRNPEYGLTWCGRKTHPSCEWVFVEPTHALLTVKKGSNMMLCPECATEMQKAIAEGTYAPPKGKKA